jgi:hypothetical protein
MVNDHEMLPRCFSNEKTELSQPFRLPIARENMQENIYRDP